jgi:MoaA/NifB/PqqE/SkfB family radical SAM enzyme
VNTMFSAIISNKKKIFLNLPYSVQLPLVKGYCNYKKKWINRLNAPATLIFFVTSRCNLRCGHCFFWQKLNSDIDRELSIDEIQKIAKSIDHPVSLSLTGGEPFLRKDLKEIIRAFHDACGTHEVGIATNGTLEASTVETVHSILDEDWLSEFSVQVSLDGLESTHDKIRGLEGSFHKSIKTIHKLKKINVKSKDFRLYIALAVQKRNLSEIENYIQFLLPMRIPLRFNIVRGGGFGVFRLPKRIASDFCPKEESSSFLTLEEIRTAYTTIKEINTKSEFKFWSTRQQRIWELSLKMLEKEQCEIPCYARLMESVLYANGDVSFCELSKSFANIRENNLDFKTIWKSEAANKMRKLISRCCCIHGCNLSTGLTFDPQTIFSVLNQR